MRYFENRFEGILERFRFSLPMFQGGTAPRDPFNPESMGEMDAIFHRHDNHDAFSKQLMNCRNSYKRQLKKEYLGI